MWLISGNQEDPSSVEMPDDNLLETYLGKHEDHEAFIEASWPSKSVRPTGARP